MNLLAEAEPISSRMGGGTYFASSARNAAFPVRDTGDHLALLLVDYGTKRLRKIGIRDSHLLSPYLSGDGNHLLFVRHAIERRESELVRCEWESLRCKSVLKIEDSISFPIELETGGILYVSSPYVVGHDGKGRYSRHDLWMLDGPGRRRKLTDMRLYELSSVSVTNDYVYFSASGSRPDMPIIPDQKWDSPKRSDIFRLRFDGALGRIERPTKRLEPLFLHEGIARSPAVSSDGSLVAFLRSRIGIGNYRFELVVRDERRNTEKTVPSLSLGYSRPVVVGGKAYANSLDTGRYLIVAAAPNTSDLDFDRLLDTTDAAVAMIDLHALSVEP
jgi:hypothetical protein